MKTVKELIESQAPDEVVESMLNENFMSTYNPTNDPYSSDTIKYLSNPRKVTGQEEKILSKASEDSSIKHIGVVNGSEGHGRVYFVNDVYWVDFGHSIFVNNDATLQEIQELE